MEKYIEAINNILKKARALENSTIRKQKNLSTVIESSNSKDKGAFGQFLQYAYFQIPPNPSPKPDFWPIPLELKAAPLKHLTKGTLVPKERIVLGVIDYESIINETFLNSHFRFKNESILIVWYIYDKSLNNMDMEINLADVWQCIKEDGKQIEEDWNFIVNKVRTGHAQDISEGDTLFLGACTKGSTAETSFRKQPNSSIKAKQRAFCFKTSYVNHIYETMKARKENRPEQHRFLSKNTTLTLETAVLNLFQPYIGLTSKEIEAKLGKEINGKSRYALIARKIIGYSRKSDSFYEFDAANIQIKTIRIENNEKIKEDMSFKNIRFKEIVNQEWEDSDLYQELTSKFIFVVFHRTADGQDYYLKNVKFWNMPESDLDIVKETWERTRLQIMANQMNNLPKKKDYPIIHVRTKGENSHDLMETPVGTMETKRCFFLSRDYVLEHVVR